MEDDLNKIFAECERLGVEVTIYSRRKEGRELGNYSVDVGLSLGDRNGGSSKSHISVGGSGGSFRAALSDAFLRLESMSSVLGWRPEYPPQAPVSNDDIPF